MFPQDTLILIERRWKHPPTPTPHPLSSPGPLLAEASFPYECTIPNSKVRVRRKGKLSASVTYTQSTPTFPNLWFLYRSWPAASFFFRGPKCEKQVTVIMTMNVLWFRHLLLLRSTQIRFSVTRRLLGKVFFLVILTDSIEHVKIYNSCNAILIHSNSTIRCQRPDICN
jgi:hypothetical protein